MRDVRDYRIHSVSAKRGHRRGNAFNVKADEVLALVGQHTAERGQAFTAEALETMWDPGAAVAGERVGG